MPDTNICAIATDRAPAPAGHYTQAVVAGGQLYISGQLPLRPDRSLPSDMSFEGQAAQALDNVLAILTAAGARPERLVRVTAYIVGVENWTRFNAVYAARLPNARPTRTVVPVAELHHGFLVEVDAIAVLAADEGQSD